MEKLKREILNKLMRNTYIKSINLFSLIKNDNIFILIAPKNGDIFTPANLEIIRNLTKKLWEIINISLVDFLKFVGYLKICTVRIK